MVEKTVGKFPWTADYSVGHDVLDRQHKQILDLCVQVRDLNEADPMYSERLHDILNSMSSYAIAHFKTEEQVLREINYPGMAEHAKEHLHYQEGLTNLLMDAINGLPDQARMRSLLDDWWGNHILLSDMKFKSYLAAA